MGSSSSKFRKYLQNGDEIAALNVYNGNNEFRKSLDPNSSYGDSCNHETPVHYASRHGMRTLLRIFLHNHHGNPNKTNSRKETALHYVCQERNSQYYTVRQRRCDCLNLILQWRGATLKDGQTEKVDLAAQDEKLNTALHYASSSGLKNCVELLVQNGSPLFIENVDQLTPCDIAEKNGHGDIALFLESKMVFSNEGSQEDHEEVVIPVSDTEEYSGLRTQDLQEVKDQLLVETADMLSVPLFTAEALLRNHEWSRETLLEAWMTDPFACCEKCGVTPPPSLYSDQPILPETLNSPTTSEPPEQDAICDICTCTFMMSEEPVHMPCEHRFCRSCWEQYLNLKIQEGDAHHITCPGYDCSRLVPVDVIENVVSRPMARRYLQFDIKAFVDSNPSMKWCPYPGCARAVHLPEIENNTGSNSLLSTVKIPEDTSRAVDCGNGHYFCWNCLGEAHEPCCCDNWKQWHQKIAEIKPEQLNGTEVETEAAANCLWLVTNSKPCPNCKSPIQKNEGCNHMKCSKCKYDFCWVCLEQWKRHNSSTGGYFKCNRYEAVKKVEQQTQLLLSEAQARNTQMQELNRFVHFYTRFKNHENSYKLEVPLLNTAKEKMMKLAEAVTDHVSAKLETKFVEDAVHQLLKARCVLKCSYVYAYYLDGPGYKKIVFECMQTELEECTEILSQIVNRLYLRTPRRRIIEQAHIVQRKRHEFIAAIVKGLVPPETPPAMRKRKRKKYSIDLEDEELRKAILASIQEVDPANPWIKDASGRHTNVMAVLDWPDSDSDSSEADTTGTSLKSIGKCSRSGCNRLQALNPRTGILHDHCSLHCLHLDHQKNNSKQQDGLPEVFLDEQMELLRALEMSRLQYMRETGLLNIPQANSEIDINSLDAQDNGFSTAAPNPGLNESHDTNMSEPLTTNQTDQNSSNEFSHQLQTMLSNILNEAVEQMQSNSSDVWVKRDLSKTENVDPATPVKSPSSNENILSRSCNSKMSLQSEIATEELEQLGAYAGAQTKPLPVSPPSTNSCFGIIKDLSVTNILATDEDKTNSFLNKDFSFGIKKNEISTQFQDASISQSRSKSFDSSTELNQSLDISANNCLKKVEMTADCSDGENEKPTGKSNFVEKAQNTVKHFDTDCVSLLEISQNLLHMTESLFENSEQDIAVDSSTEGPNETNTLKSPEASTRDLTVNDLNTVRNGNEDQVEEGYGNQCTASCDPAVSQEVTTRPNNTTKDHNEESNGQYFSV
ncbi:ankyrin repeat and IBR domain-containing protein 1 isoform X2 [Octopus sinensis]|uniref:Ankyrin repeat and IBR domain-containing protein 1 n=1 Tax=Octopus sinensis TaxID=2607531 RepID=A0A6P7TG30_9MOLL|nr:ankyrin repeat and IBR domain-containing protein 1 isoform X2 [Octopus sinensis]